MSHDPRHLLSTMASGIAVNDKCVSAYNALSKRASSIVVLKINAAMTDVEVEKSLPPGSDFESQWKAFTKTLPDAECRYIIVDFQWNDSPTVVKSKVISVLWSSDNSPIRQKMIYASSQEAVLNKMPVQRSIQATDVDELEYKVIKGAVAK